MAAEAKERISKKLKIIVRTSSGRWGRPEIYRHQHSSGKYREIILSCLRMSKQNQANINDK